MNHPAIGVPAIRKPPSWLATRYVADPARLEAAASSFGAAGGHDMP